MISVTQINPRLSCNVRKPREMFSVATSWLERYATIINALDLFPVPDDSIAKKELGCAAPIY